MIVTRDNKVTTKAQGGTFMSPTHKPVRHDACEAREILNRVGDKWSIYTIAMLRDGPQRFSQLKRAIAGISQRMLTLTLRALERDGLVTRTVHPTVPPSVEYALTELGRSLRVPVQALVEWALRHQHTMAEARRRFDAGKGSPSRSGAQWPSRSLSEATIRDPEVAG